jgi:hypothetical protein
LVERFEYNNGIKKEKNAVTFFPKENYSTSARYLKNGMDLGYEVSKVHEILRFK